MARDILNDARSELPVSNYRKEYATYLSYPAIIGKNGIEEKIQLELTDREKEKLQLSANYIKQKLAETLDKQPN